MAVIIAPGATNIDTVNDAENVSFKLRGAYGVHAVEIGGSTYVYVASPVDSGVTAFELTPGGELVLVQSIGDTPATQLANAASVTSAVVDDETYLFVAGGSGFGPEDGISVFHVSDDGTLTFVYSVADDTTLELDGIYGPMSVAEVGGQHYLVAAGSSDDGFSVFRINDDGTLTNTANVTDASNPLFELDGAIPTEVLVAGANTFVAVGGFYDHGVSIFQLNADGTLTYTDSATSIESPEGFATASVGGQTYLFVGSRNDDKITVFSVSSSGLLTNVFSVSDTDILGLDGVTGLSVFEESGQFFLTASGQHDSALTVFTIAANGSLTHVTTIRDGTAALNGTAANTVAQVGGVNYIVATGSGDNGVSTFLLGEKADTLNGTAGADTIYGLLHDDILNGFGGVDTLDGGSGADQLNGGGDIDTATYASSTVGITLDLTTPGNNTGFAAGDTFSSIERWLGSHFNDTLTGTELVEIFGGLEGNDTISGLGGNDVLSGDGGDDQLFGGNDNDQLFGAAGNDTLDGGTGDDIISGGDGDDTANGGDGHDVLFGGAGSDELFGGLGNDTVSGGNDADIVDGGDGDDTLFGGAGSDELSGGLGNDILSGGASADALLSGGDGDDQVFGGLSDDHLDGGNGADILSGGDGDDTASGGAHNDTVFGGSDDDTLNGNAGDDTVSGGTGNDIVRGDDGNDQLLGAAGSDFLDGGTGSDSLIGGAGSDILVFAQSYDDDTISGFENDIDTIQLDDALWGGGMTVADVLAAFATQTSPGIVDFDFGNGDTLRIVQGAGITVAQLENDIVIV